jgi:hypothetical protein
MFFDSANLPDIDVNEEIARMEAELAQGVVPPGGQEIGDRDGADPNAQRVTANAQQKEEPGGGTGPIRG